MTRAEKINALLTAAIFVATGASAVIFYFQWQEMKGASYQTAQIIEKSGKQVEATNNLATVAQDSIKLTKENFQKDQRPYVWRFIFKSYPITAKQKLLMTFSLLIMESLRLSICEVSLISFLEKMP
jgi:hypothetical protein